MYEVFFLYQVSPRPCALAPLRPPTDRTTYKRRRPPLEAAADEASAVELLRLMRRMSPLL
jgi:hypothetical protein